MSKLRSWLACTALAVYAGSAWAQPQAPVPPPADQALARSLLAQMVQIDSTHAHGSTVLAQWVADQLLKAGYPANDVHVLAPADHPTKGNVVVRVHGKGLGKPILYIGHLDVVEARREDWTVDPFQLTEKDGYLYGRGVLDMKGDDAALLESLIRMKREGYQPDRDIIVAFTADEEAEGDANGVDWLLRNHRDLVDAGLVLNPDAGGGMMDEGKRGPWGIQTSEKLYVTFLMETYNRGGHSSSPRPDNAIDQLASALLKVAAYRFPIHLTDTTRLYFAKTADSETGQTRSDMLAVSRTPPDLEAAERLSARHGSLLRTTCVATMIHGGEAENALPQRAQATLQCRLMPGETVEETRKRIQDAVADPGVNITLAAPVVPSGESVLTPELTARYERVIHSMWPGVVVMPTMDAGASDSVYTRAAGIPSFGASSIYSDSHNSGIHGRDERAHLANYFEGVELTYRLMKAMSQK
jgi:acetylornithine deacetylase/succinyl-diaminopimelate desuccinylase-like protein